MTANRPPGEGGDAFPPEMIHEVMGDFLVESFESLDRMDALLVTLEETPGDGSVLADIFRAVHSVKGMAGLLGLVPVQEVAHEGETLLGMLRDGRLAPTPEIVNAIMQVGDALRAGLLEVKAAGRVEEAEFDDLLQTLRRFQTAAETSPATPPPAEATEAALEAATEEERPPAERADPAEAEAEANDAGASTIPETPADSGGASGGIDGRDAETVVMPPVGRPSGRKRRRRRTTRVVPEPSAPEEARWNPSAADPAPSADSAIPATSAETSGTASDTADTKATDAEPASADEAAGSRTTILDRRDTERIEGPIRVDVSLLDALMTLVGELVLARNHLLQAVTASENVQDAAQRVDNITTELQKRILKVRMQPIGSMWTRYPRMVRTVARACGKQVRLSLSGENTELDRGLIEAIRDPMTHLLRNAVDHGIEPPEARAAAGKPREGRLSLRAYHDSGLINIEVADDGRGLDFEGIRAKAVERGLVDEAAAAALEPTRLTEFLFTPGFSTASAVTDISGRGVGMDVVKTNIERIGGMLSLRSRPGAGTVAHLKIPLTLAILPALVVRAGGLRFAIPQASLVEVVLLRGREEIENAFEDAYGAPVYRLRDTLLPILRLHAALGLPETAPPPETSPAKWRRSIVVVQTGFGRMGLVVDRTEDTREIVVKPLGRLVQRIRAYAGACTMGDGTVVPILDVRGLAQHTGTLRERQDVAIREEAPPAPAEEAEKVILLIFRSPEGERIAIPLSNVTHLAMFPRESLQLLGGQPVVRHRQRIIPLYPVSVAFGEETPQEAARGFFYKTENGPDRLRVIVYARDDCAMGLVVDEVYDIVEEACDVLGQATRPGVLGATLVQGEMTEILDVETVFRRVSPALPAEV